MPSRKKSFKSTKKTMGDNAQKKTLINDSSVQKTSIINNGFNVEAFPINHNSQVATSVKESMIVSQPVSAQPAQVSPQVSPLPVSEQSFQAAPVNANVQPMPQASIGQNASELSSIPSSFSSENSLLEETPHGKGKLWIILALIFILIALAGGGLFYFREEVIKKTVKQDEPSLKPSPSIRVVVSVTPSEATESASVKIDFSKYGIKVLNGSGISGEAAKVRDVLEEEKFVVEEIGNAESTDIKETIVKVKKDVSKEFLTKLKEVLKKTHFLGLDETLDESEDEDIVIIIGSQKP